MSDLVCGCRPVMVTDKSVAVRIDRDLVPVCLAEVAGRTCSCCGARPGKRCAGGLAAVVEPGKGHNGFKYLDVCAARILTLESVAV